MTSLRFVLSLGVSIKLTDQLLEIRDTYARVMLGVTVQLSK